VRLSLIQCDYALVFDSYAIVHAFVAEINILQMRSTLLLRLESVSTQLSLSSLDLWNTLLQVGGGSSSFLITLLGDALHISASDASTLSDVPATVNSSNTTAHTNDDEVIAIEQQQLTSELTEVATVAHKAPVKLTVSESTAAVTACVAVTQKLLNSFCADFVGSPIHPTVVSAHKVSKPLYTILQNIHACVLRTPACRLALHHNACMPAR
jgi:hypothetical protein